MTSEQPSDAHRDWWGWRGQCMPMQEHKSGDHGSPSHPGWTDTKTICQDSTILSSFSWSYCPFLQIFDREHAHILPIFIGLSVLLLTSKNLPEYKLLTRHSILKLFPSNHNILFLNVSEFCLFIRFIQKAERQIQATDREWLNPTAQLPALGLPETKILQLNPGLPHGSQGLKYLLPPETCISGKLELGMKMARNPGILIGDELNHRIWSPPGGTCSHLITFSFMLGIVGVCHPLSTSKLELPPPLPYSRVFQLKSSRKV